MIKINLATKKQSSIAVAPGKNVSLDTGKFQDLFRDLHIQKLILPLLVIYGASFYLEEHKKTQMKIWQGKVKVEQAKNRKLLTEVKKTAGYKEIQKNLEADEFLIRNKLSTIHSLVNDRLTPPRMMKSVWDSVLEGNVWLSRMEVGREQARFMGSSQDYSNISDFMSSLNQTFYFSNLNLVSTKKKAISSNLEIAEFELKADRRVVGQQK